MAHIDDYLHGIHRDLENVLPKEGHPHIKESIKAQTNRLADIARHNEKYIIQMMDEFLKIMENRHSIVDFRECDCWDVISHEQIIKEFETYLKWGLDAIDHFDEEK